MGGFGVWGALVFVLAIWVLAHAGVRTPGGGGGARGAFYIYIYILKILKNIPPVELTGCFAKFFWHPLGWRLVLVFVLFCGLKVFCSYYWVVALVVGVFLFYTFCFFLHVFLLFVNCVILPIVWVWRLVFVGFFLYTVTVFL